MRAFVVSEYAHPSQIPLTQDAPAPKLGRGQVLVDVYSAGLNYFDVRPLSPLLSGSPSTPRRSCNPRASTRTSHHGRSCSAASSRGASPKVRPFPRGAHSVQATASSVPRRARSLSALPSTGRASSRSRITCPTTRAQVRCFLYSCTHEGSGSVEGCRACHRTERVIMDAEDMRQVCTLLGQRATKLWSDARS